MLREWIKNHKIIAGLLLVAAVAAGSYGSYRTYRSYEERVLARAEAQDAERLLADPKTKETYERLQSRLRALADAPDRVGPRYDVALEWKTLGSLTNEKKYYARAVRMYEEIIEILGHKSYLPYVNAGNVYRVLGEFDQAEKRYTEAKVISPGEPTIYLAIAEMYRFDLHKPSEEVLAVYREALGRLTEVEQVLIAYGSYLQELGRIEEAIEAYEKLEKLHPGMYQGTLSELRNKK